MPDQYSNTRRAEPVISDLYSEYRNCDRWAIIVGISRYRYQGWNLRYADRDAEELYNLLLTPSGGNFKKEFICKLTNEEATTGNITRALRAFLKKPAREDLVVIYFACHGTPDFDRPSNVYLLTHDTAPDDIAGTALPMREIDLSLKENLHAEKVIVLADTCHSAAIGGGIGRRAVDDSTFVNRYLQEVSRARGGIALLTSAEATEVSFEDARWGGGHGVFTHYLLEGMRGAADRDGNGIVTVGELFEYVRDNVKRATDYRQHPLIGANAYDRNLPMAIVPGGDSVVKENLNQLEKLKDKPLSARESLKITSNDTDINFLLTETLSDSRGTIWSCAISPNGRLIAASSGPIPGGIQLGGITLSGGSDNTIRIWDIESSKLIHSISGYGSDFPSLAFGSTSNELILAGGSGDNTIKLWDVKTWREVRVIPGHSGWIDVVAFAPSGAILASGSSDETIKIWDVKAGHELITLPGHKGLVDSIAFSADGAILASGCGDNTIRLWDVKTGQLLHTLSGHTDSVRAVAFSSSGQILASGSNDKTIKLWHLETKKELRTLYGHSKEVQSVAFMPNRSVLASGSWDNTIRLWDIDSGKCLNTLSGHNDVIYSIAFSPDGQILVSGSADTSVKIWRC